MKKILGHLLWAAIAVLAALCLAAIALNRNEHINSFWLVVASACTYLVGFRFYAKFLSARVMGLDDKRATPAERLRDGHDFEPTNKWIVFGHHFAAIAGPGPLVGPTLAAQFGYLPGTLWIIIGAVLGGAVQDFVILFCSMRRDGKSLGQMAREEIGAVGGFTALLTVLFIMIILLAVVALVVVNALKGSPWGTFTIAATMPIATAVPLIEGGQLRALAVNSARRSAVGLFRPYRRCGDADAFDAAVGRRGPSGTLVATVVQRLRASSCGVPSPTGEYDLSL
jgi:carbon starvation protein